VAVRALTVPFNGRYLSAPVTSYTVVRSDGLAAVTVIINAVHTAITITAVIISTDTVDAHAAWVSPASGTLSGRPEPRDATVR